MACALKVLTKAAGVAVIKAQKEAFDAVHKLLEEYEVDYEVIQALEELTAKFTAGKPKRAKTGYNLFIAEHMKESKAEKPDLKSVDHMKLACAAWKELADDEQEKYREMARALGCSNGASASDSDTVVEEEVESLPVSQAKKTKAKPKAKKEIVVAPVEEVEEVEEESQPKPKAKKTKGKGKSKKEQSEDDE